MDQLPENADQEILNYLHLEYGEDPSDESSLKLSDLKYLGAFDVDGEKAHCWQYPSTGDNMWATLVYFDENNYSISMTSIPEKYRDIRV